MVAKLGEDEWTETWEGNNGRVLTVAKPVAQKMFGGIGPDPSMPPDAQEPPPVPELAPAPQTLDPFSEPQEVAPQGPQTLAPEGFGPEPGSTPEIVAEPQRQTADGRQIQSRDDFRASTFERKAAAADQKATAEAAQADARAEALREFRESEDTIGREAERRRQTDEAEIQAARARKEAEIEKYNEMDPQRGRWWESRSTGQRVLAALGVALSGIGNALKGQGGKNDALQIIQASIDDDVNDQIRAQQRQKQTIGLAQETVEGSQADASRHAQQMAEGRAQRQRALVTYLDEVQSRTTNPIVAAKAEETKAQLMMEYSKNIDDAARWEKQYQRQLRQDERQSREDDRQYRLNRSRVGLQRRGLKLREAELEQRRQESVMAADLKRREAEAKRGDAEAAAAIRDPTTGERLFVSARGMADEKQAVKDQQYVTNIAALTRDAAALRKLYDTAGRKVGYDVEALKDTDRRRIDALRQKVAYQIARANDPSGRLSDADVESAAKQIADQLTMTAAGDPAKVVDDLIARTRSDFRLFANEVGMPSKASSRYDKSLSGIVKSQTRGNAPLSKTQKLGVELGSLGSDLAKSRNQEKSLIEGPMGSINAASYKEQVQGRLNILAREAITDDEAYRRLKQAARGRGEVADMAYETLRQVSRERRGK